MEKPDFAALLREKGFKATPGRVALLRTLWSATRPLSVEEIARHLDLNTVTLYRALSDLAQAGLILRGVGSGDMRAAHFSYPKSGHHHHLVCADCGFIRQCANCA